MRNISFILILVLLFPFFVLAQQEKGIVPIQAPQTLDEAKSFGQHAFQAIPDAIATIWKEEVAPVWTKMFSFAKDLWDRFIAWRIEHFINTVRGLIGGDTKKQSPAVQQEVIKQKETIQEIQKEKEKVSQSFWERFAELFKK